MTWGFTATTQAPYGQVLERGGYSYSQQGWQGGGGGGWSGGWKGAATSKGGGEDSSAALSALALLSFLFFLNMLQQQILSNTGQQTLVFMTTGGGNGTFGRRRRDAAEGWGEQDATFQLAEFLEDEETMGADSGAGRLENSAPTTGDRVWRDVTARLRSLPPGVASLLPSCRAVLACSLHLASRPSLFEPHLVTEVLRELRPADGLDEACAALLADEHGQCGPLARSFSAVLPSLERTTLTPTHFKHDPHDML